MLTLKTSNNKPLVNKKPEIWSENPIVSSSLLLSSDHAGASQWLLNIAVHRTTLSVSARIWVNCQVQCPGYFRRPPSPSRLQPPAYFYRHSNNVSGFLYSFKWKLSSYRRISWEVNVTKYFLYWIISVHLVKRFQNVGAISLKATGEGEGGRRDKSVKFPHHKNPPCPLPTFQPMFKEWFDPKVSLSS